MIATGDAGRAARLAFLIALPLLVVNGRAIGAGDTAVMERTAAAIVERHSVILTEAPGSEPFTRAVPQGRVSIYPVLPALLAAPLFGAFRLFFDLDFAGTQIAGKLAAALFTALAGAAMASAFARRTSVGRGLAAALVFTLGTAAFSTSQALWQHPVALLFLALALSAMERATGGINVDGADARGRDAFLAGACLALAAAARTAAIPMIAVLFVFLLRRVSGQRLRAVLGALGPALAVALFNTALFGAPWRFGPATSGRFFAEFPSSLAGLLISPARGLLIFTPVALVAAMGLQRAGRTSPFARALAAAAVTHLFFVSLWNEWHGGESFGPRLLADVLPALFYFLPEGLALWPKAGALLAAWSILAQAVGGWTYDYRWERLYQRGADFKAALWDWRDAPLIFAAREGVVSQGSPEVEGRRLRLRVQRFVPFGPAGSIIEPGDSGLRVSGGSDANHIRLERGARVSEGGIVLNHPADALAFRGTEDGPRALRLSGTLAGVLRVEANGTTLSQPVDGAFDVALSLVLRKGEEVVVRGEPSGLRLTRVEIAEARY